MTLVYRTEKGAPLTPSEVDGNFHDLDDRVGTIEDNPVEPIAPVSISMTGNSFTMGLSNGETLGPITFTIPMPLWRGNWAPDTNYKEMDFFIPPDGGMGAVMWPHISAATFDWAAVNTDGELLYRMLVGSDGTTAGLSDLNDVALSGLLGGHMLVYDAVLSLWVNATPQQVAEILPHFTGDAGSGGLSGTVPAPAPGDAAAGKVLGASGLWVVPPAGSGGGSTALAGLSDVSINSPIDNSLLQYKSGDGKWHNSSFLDLGAGTVTSVTAGTGLSGGTITAAGTIALAAAPAATLLANTAGGSAVPVPATLTAALDVLAGSTRGSLLQRDAIGWQLLAPGSAGLFLRTGGTGADLSWASPAGNGTVTSITAGAGLSGGTITGAGTIGLAAIADDRVLANVSGGSSPPTETSVTALLDAALGTTRGSIIRRDGSAWSALAPSTAGHVLTTGGSGADVSWAPGGAGASVSVGDAPPTAPDPGALWWDSASGNLFIRYADPDTTQWVVAVNQPGPQGATGATGATGPAGATGATGPNWTVGSGLTLSSSTISLTTPALPLAGGTLTGGLTGTTATFSGLLTVGTGSGWGRLNLNKPVAAGNLAIVEGQAGGVARWNILLGDGTAESGGNAGSNFSVQRYNDAGVYQGDPLAINRATGNAAFSGSITAGSGVAVSGNANASLSLVSGFTSLLAPDSTGATQDRGVFVSNTATASIYYRHSVHFIQDAAGASGFMTVNGSGVVVGVPTGGAKGAGTVNATAVYANNVVLTSDANLKTDIEPLSGCLDAVLAVEPRSYRWAEPDPPERPNGEGRLTIEEMAPPGFYEERRKGFLAQDFGAEDGVAVGELIATLWQAVRELSAKVEALEAAR